MPGDALANPMALAALGALLERPMHTYELARTLAQRGVPANRGTLYDTVQALVRAGWVEPRPTEREGHRPQRTPYLLTDAGRQELVRRLDAQIRSPRPEFPEFLGAVSHLGVLGREGASAALIERAGRLSARIEEGEARLGRALADDGVPRLFVIGAEYSLAMLRAEREWVLTVVEEIGDGRLEWPAHRAEEGMSDG